MVEHASQRGMSIYGCNEKLFARREILKTSAMVLGGTLLAHESIAGLPQRRQHEFQPFHAEDHRYARGDDREAGAKSLPDHSHRHESGRIWTG